ncbi:MAG: LysM peptidoglycan-binding domain-containing protein [Oscillospiraceae bacterium]|nr:LysM peptidoglycan-binding domain-containing protein [Oscillospiraceae bacterium]
MADEVKLNDIDLAEIDGGAGPWQNYARGTYVNYGSYIIYTVAGDDVLTGIGPRFGVTVAEICQWNGIPDANRIYAGQHLTIYPRIIR